VEAARDEAGLKVAVLVSVPRDTVPEMLVPALFFNVKVEVETVVLWTASLNVATIEEVTATPVTPLPGLVLTTVGGVVSAAAAVVNDHILSEAIALPAKSFTPVVIVTVYDVEDANSEECEKVTVLRSALNASVPGKLVPALFFTVNIEVLDQLCTASLNVAVTGEVTATPVTPLSGLVLTTVGGVVSEEDVELAT
jgi:hypothetical protein